MPVPARRPRQRPRIPSPAAPKRTGCYFWVSGRQYSADGPCEKRHGLQKFAWEGKRVTGCVVHRKQAAEKKPLKTVKDELRRIRVANWDPMRSRTVLVGDP